MSVVIFLLLWILCGAVAIKIVSRIDPDPVGNFEAGFLVLIGPMVVLVAAIIFAIWLLGKCIRFIARA